MNDPMSGFLVFWICLLMIAFLDGMNLVIGASILIGATALVATKEWLQRKFR